MTAELDLSSWRRPFRARSYLTAVQIIGTNARNILADRALELNEMTGRPELGRKPLRDVDVSIIRALIEERFVGAIDKAGNEIGLSIAAGDVFAACEQVAAEHAYHPVRDYLSNLVWDGVERLSAACEDLLGAPRTPLNQALVERFLISAVARVFDPGCKVDTVLVLVGAQGAMKSSFFRTLSAPWFIDTAVDIHDKDSFQVLRGAWIYEWAELEVLRRAKDAAAAKAFLSSSVDTYRPPYGRLVISVPRSGVIVGSTNNDEFLTDDTGNRRFWPLVVGAINIDLVAEQRDQLWAEAVALYRAKQPWWLSESETEALAGVHGEHAVGDIWEEDVLGFANARVVEFTTADVIRESLKKPSGQWTRGDEMRVAAILRRSGWRQGSKRTGSGGRPWKK